MTSKDLKLMAGNMILESTYSKSAKKQLFHFIATEANNVQIKSLIIDGKMVKISEDAEQIVNKRFDNIAEVGMIEILENTLSFMKIARETICEYLETLNHPEESLIEMKNFVLKEATDYQVMSMLMEKGLPEDNENLEEEYNLFETFNNEAGTNLFPLSEFEVSSSELTMLVEADTPRIAALKNQISKNVDIMNKWSKTKGPKSDIRKAQIKQNISKLKGEIGKEKSKMASAGAAVGGTAKGMAVRDLAKRGVAKGKTIATKGYKAGKELAGKGKTIATKGYKAGKELAGKGIVKGKAAAVKAAAKTKELADKGKVAAAPVITKGKIAAGKGATLLKQKAIIAKSKLRQMAAKLPSAASIASKAKAFATSGAGMALGGTALAALLAYGASKIYKSYFSKAAKACAGQGDKAGCMAKYKTSAVKAQIADLSKSASACAKSKNPDKCKAAIQNKINKLKSKLA